MIAKYNGVCSVTGQRIIAGKTEITRTKEGKWKIAMTREEYLAKCGYIRNGDVQEMVKERITVPAGGTSVWAWSDVDQNRFGDEVLIHYASFADEDGEPVGRLWKFDTATEAEGFASRVGANKNLPVEFDTIRQ